MLVSIYLPYGNDGNAVAAYPTTKRAVGRCKTVGGPQ